MGIGGISGLGFGVTGYAAYQATATMQGTVAGADRSSGTGEGSGAIKNPGESVQKAPGRKSSPAECQTCKERKYQDGSDEANVSFKAAAHVSPSAAGSAVRAHEQQHVSNAYRKASQNNGKVLACNVTLKTAVCPECGRSYVSGGVTSTQIKYYNEENPYQKDLKSSDRAKYLGSHVDLAG